MANPFDRMTARMDRLAKKTLGVEAIRANGQPLTLFPAGDLANADPKDSNGMFGVIAPRESVTFFVSDWPEHATGAVLTLGLQNLTLMSIRGRDGDVISYWCRYENRPLEQPT
ncbi:MAG: hypothetical protein ACRDDD_04860 [Plesiomonas sp.]|uniref:hypothetical protein n=1 Tax=Plesiomonas sp. TaxID=2486279 RepID=UPI003EE5ECB1